jgi:glycosyltransferase involved in cell wall biosynthesis
MISAVVLTHNEEKNIKDCLVSLSWCDEIIVIDDNSTDKTVDIIKKTKANLYVRALNNNFSDQRNFGLSKTKGEWVLFVDADERVTSQLWYEIMQHSNQSINNEAGFYIKRQDYMWGRKLRYGETGNVKFVRFAKKDAGKWEGAVHEEWKINGNLATLKNPLLHYPHKNIVNFLNEINHYTDIRAEELYNKKVKLFWPTILIYPSAKFILNYIFKLGFLDGVPGLIFALIMSFHSFLVRGKLWLLLYKIIRE